MKVIIVIAAAIFAMIPSLVSAKTLHKVCVHVPDKYNAGTDDDLFINIHGTNGDFGMALLDNPGDDDNNRNTISCFDIHDYGETGNLSWFHMSLGGDDDVCFVSVKVTYYLNDVLQSELKIHPNDPFQNGNCIGDDAGSNGFEIRPN